MTATRGTTNRNDRGSSYARAVRRKWLVATYRADVDLSLQHSTDEMTTFTVEIGYGIPACRCYRCGQLLTEDIVTADRIIPGCRGGTYARGNIRPCCLDCNSITGGSTRSKKIPRAYIRKSPGDRFGRVVLVEYLGKRKGNGYWLCICDCGNEMRVQSGQLKTVQSCGKGVCNSQFKETPTYQRMHSRLNEARGAASEHRCADCEEPAAEWSYDGNDPDELHSDLGYAYSTDLTHYYPRCYFCHRKHDRRKS